MASLFLTDPFIRSLRPTERGRVEYWDDNGAGLSIRVSQTGRKTWSLMYRVNGRLRRFTLGVYPVLGLADARRKAGAALRGVAGGSDPAAARIEARKAETFAELAAEYVENHARFKKSGDEDQRILYGSPHKKRTGKRPYTGLVKRWGAMKYGTSRDEMSASCSMSSDAAAR